MVPEFDIPATPSAGWWAYPELAAGPGPYEIGRHWGVFRPGIDPASPRYRFLDGLIGEMAGLFPDDYFHIGGDEVNGSSGTPTKPTFPLS